MEVFVHLDGTTEVKRHRVELVDTTGTLIRQFGDKNSQVWRSATEPLAADDFLVEFGVMENDHLHICSCRHIKVQVRHGADVKDAEFSPGGNGEFAGVVGCGSAGIQPRAVRTTSNPSSLWHETGART